MYNQNQLVDIVKQRLSEYRFNHSYCVARQAVLLAEKYGVNTQKAFVAGILHDITKEDSPQNQKNLLKNAGITLTPLEIDNEKVYHQMSGAVFISQELGITDSEILDAVRYHTTGRANMSLLECVIYLADFTSDDRCYPDVNTMRAKTNQSIFDGMLYSLSYTISDLVSKNRQIHPDTLHCYNWVVNNIKRE